MDEIIPKEQYLRLAADFENYKKRARQDMTDAVQFGNEKLLLEIADVLDAIDRSKNDAYDMGALLQQILKKHGVTRIETKDKPFDPNTMEAVSMASPASPDDSGKIKEEVRAGYTMPVRTDHPGGHGRVIRPVRVIIYQ